MDGIGARVNNTLSSSRVIDILGEPCYNYDIATRSTSWQVSKQNNGEKS